MSQRSSSFLLSPASVLTMLPLAVLTLLVESGSGLWSPLMEDMDQKNQLSSDVARVCLSPECKEAAASLLASMNVSADPCTDFFEYACGGWVRSHPVPTTDSHWNQFNLVDEQLTLQIKDILESDERKEEPSPVKAARNHYSVCMNSENLVLSELEEVKPILELLARYGGWPMTSRRWSPNSFHWLNMLADITRDLGISPIITVYPNVDRKHSNQSVLTVDQPSLVVPRSMLVEPAPYRGQLEAYRLWVFRTAGLLARASGREVPPELLRLQAEEIVNFETKIAKISSPVEMRRSMVRTYNPMSLRELQAWTDLAAPGLVNWMIFFRRLLAGTEVTVDWSERLVVREVDYIFKVVQLVRDTPLKVLANYLHWRVVKSLSSDLNGKMKQLAFEFEKVFTGATQEQPRWKECIGSTNSAYGMAIGYVYVQKHFDNDAKKVALEMSENIKRVFSDEISRLSWMDVKTQEAARHKVETMIQLIGYPVWLHNTSALEHYFHGMKTGNVHFDNVIESRRHIGYRILNKLRDSISRDEWPIPAAVVNAYYNPQANSIIFPAGILQPPFFKKGRIEALNYGGIGVVIGHEITHGFDDVGRQSDADGNLAGWWSDETIETYVGIADCFIKQYSRYRLPQLDLDLLKQVTVNGVTTQGENIADNGGLHSALLAYRRHLERTGPEPALPGLQHLTSEQLFFIAFATNWCESSTKESLLEEILSDPHSPHRFRVQGSLANSADFAAAFSCPAPLSPCRMW